MQKLKDGTNLWNVSRTTRKRSICVQQKKTPAALSGLRNETRQEVTKPALPLMTTGGPLHKPTAEMKVVQRKASSFIRTVWGARITRVNPVRVRIFDFYTAEPIRTCRFILNGGLEGAVLPDVCTCRTLLGRPVLCARQVQSLPSGLCFWAKYDSNALSCSLRKHVLIRLVLLGIRPPAALSSDRGSGLLTDSSPSPETWAEFGPNRQNRTKLSFKMNFREVWLRKGFENVHILLHNH